MSVNPTQRFVNKAPGIAEAKGKSLLESIMMNVLYFGLSCFGFLLLCLETMIHPFALGEEACATLYPIVTKMAFW